MIIAVFELLWEVNIICKQFKVFQSNVNKFQINKFYKYMGPQQALPPLVKLDMGVMAIKEWLHIL